ncbi:MAG: hypothetical protein ACYDAD_14200 [Acidimicrobiales bacterium]
MLHTFPDRLEDVFGEKSPKALAKAFDAFQKSLDKSWHDGVSGKVRIRPMGDGNGNNYQVLEKVASDSDQVEAMLARSEILKGLNPDVLQSLQAQVEAAKASNSTLNKDFDLTSPLASGYVPFDLETPAKFLSPHQTPLRNMLPRADGQGTSRRYKRITGISGSGTGGVGDLLPVLDGSASTQDAIGRIRGKDIAYAGDERSIAHREFALRTSVPWSTQFQGQGFMDARAFTQAALLYSSMLEEEKMLLGARGIDATSAFVGALAAPAGVTATARAAAATETGVTTAGTYWIKVTADAQFGDSVPSAVVSVALTAGQVADITVGTEPNGAQGYNVYANGPGASDPGDATRAFQGRTGWKTFTLFGTTGALATVAPFVPTVDGTANTKAYDGILSYVLDTTQSGNVNRINAALSTANPGVEFQNVFLSLWRAVKANPDMILAEAGDSKQLSDTLKVGTATNYRLTATQSEIGGIVLGDAVTVILNEATRKLVNIVVHPWLKQGVMPIISTQIPIQDSQVPNPWQVVNVQDYMGVAWPVDQFKYEFSSYWLNTLISYAPAWSGALAGVKAV